MTPMARASSSPQVVDGTPNREDKYSRRQSEPLEPMNQSERTPTDAEVEDELRDWHFRKIMPMPSPPSSAEESASPSSQPSPPMVITPPPSFSPPQSLSSLVTRLEEPSAAQHQPPLRLAVVTRLRLEEPSAQQPPLRSPLVTRLEEPSAQPQPPLRLAVVVVRGEKNMDPPGISPPKGDSEQIIPGTFNRTRPVQQGQHGSQRESSSATQVDNDSRLGEDNSSNIYGIGIDDSSRSNDGSRRNSTRSSVSSSSTRTKKHHNKKENSFHSQDYTGRNSTNTSSSSSTRKKKHQNKKKAPDAASTSSNEKTPSGKKEEQSQNKDSSPSSVSTASAASSSHSNNKKHKKKSKHASGHVASNKNEKNSKSTNDVSNKAPVSATSKPGDDVSCSTQVSSDEFMSKKKIIFDDKSSNRFRISDSYSMENNGGRPSGTGSNPSKEHPASRIEAIHRKEQIQREEIDSSTPKGDKANGTSRKIGSSSIFGSTTSALRRCLKSYKPGKRRQTNQGKDEQKKDMKKNPYSLDEKTSNVSGPILISSIERHDICITPNSSPHAMEHHDGFIPDPPALVLMTPHSTKKTDLLSSLNSSSHLSSLNSSSQHNSLLSISEHDVLRESLLSISEHGVLRERDFLKHSSHSDGEAIRGKDGMKYSAHSEGTGITSMTSMSTFDSHPRSPNILGSSNSERRFKLPTIPLPAHQEGSSDMDSASISSIMTNYSNIHRTPMALKSLASKSLTGNAFAINDDTTCILNLPWSHEEGDDDIDPDKRIHGKYSGPVNNDFLQPHGEGALVIQDGNGSLTFYGRWSSGKLISRLSAEPEREFRSPSIEGSRGSSHDEISTTPRKSSNFQQSQRTLEHTRISSSSHDVNDSNKGVDIKYIMNKSGKPKNIESEYTLGEGCRSPMEMIIHRSDKKAIQSTALLKKWDQAFVKRSNGLWTAAVMIDRALQPKNISKRHRRDRGPWFTVWEIDPHSMDLEENMLFAINGDGATKIISRKRWGKHVRRIKDH
eukprot:CAMPEP_0201916410 /NCGR_PEP_ID=MMETSP0903-20130614/6044_1 /ASSEMBLY_ACC=CAM_ASM_000552 /TAXON_ID=420261 /ORGANISM="Thalassiosira antarctica, Strain CCMP982" /LENGTH=1004 /DNA_ID=CAMNT_0048452207 /DNA_START=247 /DNA_END=3261 /DNA_ORIENTATION=-